ncbi:MAG: hypothetical protein ACTHMK_11255 [Dyella sp.]|uniref:hypothetical protein n=1 Tax=Dyella sp. TaxID=1869338 RepID=UPI003F7EA7BB
MTDIELILLDSPLTLSPPWHIRTIAFEVPTLDLLKDFQRRLEGWIRRDTSNAEALKYLIHTHPEVRALDRDR